MMSISMPQQTNYYIKVNSILSLLLLVKKLIKCQDCEDKVLKLSINRFKCDACRSILCREHYKIGLIYGLIVDAFKLGS